MHVRRRMIPAAALALAIGASAAGAATAAATTATGGHPAGGSATPQKPVCKIVLNGGSDKGGPVFKGGPEFKGTAIKGPVARLAGEVTAKLAGDLAGKAEPKGPIVLKGGAQPPECLKQVQAVSLDTIAAKLGVSKTALVQALKQSGQWMITSATKPSVAEFEQHLAGLLHVPVAEVTSLFGPGTHFVMKTAS